MTALLAVAALAAAYRLGHWRARRQAWHTLDQWHDELYAQARVTHALDQLGGAIDGLGTDPPDDGYWAIHDERGDIVGEA